MKISSPLPRNFPAGQPFTGNFNPLYANAGLKGHGAIDYPAPYGTTMYSVVDCYVYSNINMGASPDRYRAVYTIFDDPDFSYEISYGHVIDSLVPLEAHIARGTPIARVGNFGDVYTGGHYVTKEEKIAGSTDGSHIHFQIRKCKRVQDLNENKEYLKNQNGYVKMNGYYYEIQDYDNGYNGCIDPAQFFDGTFGNDFPQTPPIPAHYYFTTPFSKSCEYSKDCDEMQQLLTLKGFMQAIPYQERGYYGDKTAKAVLTFQVASIKLSWYEKYYLAGSKVGKKTLEALNNLI